MPETGGRVSTGAALREIHAIWRKSNYLIQSPEGDNLHPPETVPDTGRRPLRRNRCRCAAILRGQEANACQGIQGGGRDHKSR